MKQRMIGYFYVSPVLLTEHALLANRITNDIQRLWDKDGDGRDILTINILAMREVPRDLCIEDIPPGPPRCTTVHWSAEITV